MSNSILMCQLKCAVIHVTFVVTDCTPWSIKIMVEVVIIIVASLTLFCGCTLSIDE